MIHLPELNDILFFDPSEADADDYVYDIPDDVMIEQFKILMNYRFLTESGQEVDSSFFRRSTPLNPDIIGFRKGKFDLLVQIAPLCILEVPNESSCYCLHTSDFFGVVERLMYDTLNYEGHVNKALVRFQWAGKLVKTIETIDMNQTHVINGAYSSIPLLTYLASGISGSPRIKTLPKVRIDASDNEKFLKTLSKLMGPKWIITEQDLNNYTIRKKQVDPDDDPIGDDHPDINYPEINKYEQLKSIILLICLIILARTLSK